MYCWFPNYLQVVQKNILKLQEIIYIKSGLKYVPVLNMIGYDIYIYIYIYIYKLLACKYRNNLNQLAKYTVVHISR